MRHSVAVPDFRRVTADMTSSADADDDVEVLPGCVSLLRNGAPLGQAEVSVTFDPVKHARQTNSAQDAAIASQWRRRARANSRLYNASKFRVAAVLPASDLSGASLQLGLTSYRDHLGSNCSGGSAARLLQEAGRAVHGDSQAFMADCLGVGALVYTADNRLAFVRRAAWTGEYPLRVDRPGGHAEPHYLLQQLHHAAPDRYPLTEPGPPPPPGGSKKTPEEDQKMGDTVDLRKTDDEEAMMRPLRRLPHDAVLHEVFESIQREVRDELGIPITHLSQPLLMGMIRDLNKAARPTLEFIIRCSLPSTEVERIYKEGHQSEADESLGLIFLHRDELVGSTAIFHVPELHELLYDPATVDVGPAPGQEASRSQHHETSTEKNVDVKVVQNGHCSEEHVATQNRINQTVKSEHGLIHIISDNAPLTNGINGHTSSSSPDDSRGGHTSRVLLNNQEEAPTATVIEVRCSTPQQMGQAPAPAQDEEEDAGEVVIVQENGTILLHSPVVDSQRYTTETLGQTQGTSPSNSSALIETAAQVVHNPDDTPTVEDEVAVKQLLWKEMTPGCKGSLVLLKQLKLKGLVFPF